MSWTVNYNVKSWSTKLDPFILTIMAFDDENKRISNRQFYIKYDITFDNTEASTESETAQTIYSNKDGIIEIPFEKKACHVSIDVYRVRIFDKFLDLDDDGYDYIKETLCSNIFIPFEPYITSFKAIYLSDVAYPVGDPIPLRDIKIEMEYSNGAIKNVTANELEECYITPDTIQVTGDNKVSVFFNDLLLDKIWKYDIIVLGKSKELEIRATYTGGKKQILSFITKIEVNVVVILYNGYEEYQEILDTDLWEFTTLPQINNVNLGVFTIMHNDLTTQIRVPFQYLSSDYTLEAWYEGLPVKVGKKYVPDNFRIYLWHKKSKVTMLKYSDVSVEPDDMTLTVPGLRWFIVSYTIEGFTLKDKVGIWCVEEDDMPDIDFLMLYYNKNTQTLEDVTKHFEECTKINDERYINWGKILTQIEQLKVYGTYKLIVEPLTGLSTRYITEWNIYCDSKKGIRSGLIASYKTKEDYENGCKEES